jgi:hypothetical protein
MTRFMRSYVVKSRSCLGPTPEYRLEMAPVVIVVDDPSPFDPANDHVMQRTGSI